MNFSAYGGGKNGKNSLKKPGIYWVVFLDTDLKINTNKIHQIQPKQPLHTSKPPANPPPKPTSPTQPPPNRLPSTKPNPDTVYNKSPISIPRSPLASLNPQVFSLSKTLLLTPFPPNSLSKIPTPIPSAFPFQLYIFHLFSGNSYLGVSLNHNRSYLPFPLTQVPYTKKLFSEGCFAIRKDVVPKVGTVFAKQKTSLGFVYVSHLSASLHSPFLCFMSKSYCLRSYLVPLLSPTFCRCY